ncbi:signal peptide, CUB and EGF-like domain-containing protein 2 isoform X3 [Mya arenaria]|uniref:signal peptide, CUB and EGF-like domain-containing protein 2 isoform X3 n=1 Tax=Mya arenaria TaxID=6604 RepID=UPI0022DF557D|nr:signal peptide, CUB and EGF-like domain-containing protein 2 isoform X3 [Mya arenaria]
MLSACLLTTAIGIVATIQQAFANVGTTCTANGNECVSLTGAYCDLDADGGAKCACAAIYKASDDGNTTCIPKNCAVGNAVASNSVCRARDSKSKCDGDVCICKPTFVLTGADDSDGCALVIGSSCAGDFDCEHIQHAVCPTIAEGCACPATFTASKDRLTCVPNKIGSTCTNNGGECADIANSVCDISGDRSVCACPATHTEGTAQNTCIEKNCTEDTTCATSDDNAICSDKKCGCDVTFEISNSKLCQKRVIGSSCKNGGECAGIASAVCDSFICSCPATHTANAGGSQCTTKISDNAIGPAVSVILLFTCFLSTFLR